MDLALQADRIHDRADVVDHGIALEPDLAGLGIDLDLADVATVGIGVLLSQEGGVLVEPALEALGPLGGVERRHRHLLQRHRLVGAGDLEDAIGELDVLLAGLEQVPGDHLALRDHLARRLEQGRAAQHRRTGAVGAHAEGHTVGVAVDELHVGGVDSETLVQDLLEHRLVTLALVLGAHQKGRRAARVEADLRILRLRGTGGLLDRIDDAEPAQLAALLRVLGAGRIARHVGQLDRHVHVLLELATVVERAHRTLVGQRRFGQDVLAAQRDAVDA